MLSLSSAVSGFASVPRSSSEFCYCAPARPNAPTHVHVTSGYHSLHATSPIGFGPMTAKVQPYFHAPTAGGNYPLTMDDPLDSLNYHQMCFDGNTAYMGTAGTHSPSGLGQCAPEYHDLSAEDGADCSAMIMTAGPCGAAAVDPVPSANEPVTHTIQWTAGFGDEAARATTANVGDTLRFVWEGNHNVYQMNDKAAFDSCDFTRGFEWTAVSPFDFTLEPSTFWRTAYFACSIADHCVNGQKLAVTQAP